MNSKRFVEKLIEKTIDGDLQWQSISTEPNSPIKAFYYLSFRDGLIHLFNEESPSCGGRNLYVRPTLNSESECIMQDGELLLRLENAIIENENYSKETIAFMNAFINAES